MFGSSFHSSILERKRLSGFIIDEIKDRCQGIIGPDRFAGHFAVQGQIFMGNGLFAGNMGPAGRRFHL